jgi:hypothetical protein
MMTISIDTRPPETLSGPTSPVNLSDATISTKDISVVFSSESGATFQCSLDGLVYTGCTSPVSYRFLSEGAHTLRIRTIDIVGNIDITPLTITFSVNSI